MSDATVPQHSRLDIHIEGLTAVREFLADHPELPPMLGIYGDSVHLHLFPHDLPDDVDVRDEFARHARTLMAGAPIGSVTKETSESYMSVSRKVGGFAVVLQADRNTVCEQVVVGTETVEIPAVEAQPARTETREVVRWECAPILAESEAVLGMRSPQDAYERAEDQLTDDYNAGLLSEHDYQVEMRELGRQYSDDAEAAAQDAYDSEMEMRGFYR